MGWPGDSFPRLTRPASSNGNVGVSTTYQKVPRSSCQPTKYRLSSTYRKLLGLSGTQLVSGVWGLVTPNAHTLSLQCAASCANPLCELRTGRSDCGGWSERAWTGNSRWDSGGQRQRGSVADSHVGGVSVTNPTPPPHLLRQHQRTQQSSWERQRPTSLPP